MPVFSIGCVRSWKHDVRGYGQRMGDHHFRNLFTLSPSHIELLVASPLCLTRAHNLFFHHLIYLLHRVGDPVVLACYDWIHHKFQTWHTYSGLIPHSSLWYFPLDIISSLFSDITYRHLWYPFSVFSFIIAYSTLSLFHLEWCFFTHHCMEDCHVLPPSSPHGQWFKDFILRGCLVSEDSCYIRMWRGFDNLCMYFHVRSFIIDQSMR